MPIELILSKKSYVSFFCVFDFKKKSVLKLGPHCVCSGISSQSVSVRNAADEVWVMLNVCTPWWNILVRVFRINY